MGRGLLWSKFAILVQIGLLLSSDKMTPLSWRQFTGKFDFPRCMFTIPAGDDR